MVDLFTPTSSFRYGPNNERKKRDSPGCVKLGLSVACIEPIGHSSMVLPMVGQLQDLETKGVAEITMEISFPRPQTGSLRRLSLPTCYNMLMVSPCKIFSTERLPLWEVGNEISHLTALKQHGRVIFLPSQVLLWNENTYSLECKWFCIPTQEACDF